MRSPIFLVSAGTGLCLSLAGAALADGLLPPPLQVEGLVSYREPYRVEGLARRVDRDAAPGTLEGPFVVVDLGPARIGLLGPDAWPDQFATIVGTEGHLRATRQDLVRTCEYPCGPNEFEECHFSALYRPDSPIAEIGTPLIAFEGRHDLENFRSAIGRSASLDSLSLASGLSSTVWGDQPQYGFRDQSGQDRQITVASDRSQLDGLRWQDCSLDDFGALQRLQCGPANGALLSDGRPVLVSMEEGMVSVLATFSAEGQSYTVIQRGYTIGLLARTAPGWRGLVRPVRHAQTCG